MKACILDLADDRPEQNRHCKGYITAPGAYFRRWRSAIEVHRWAGCDQIDHRSVHRRAEDSGRCFIGVREMKTMLVVESRWWLHRSTTWCDWTSHASRDGSPASSRRGPVCRTHHLAPTTGWTTRPSYETDEASSQQQHRRFHRHFTPV